MTEKKRNYIFNPVAVIPDKGQLLAALLIFLGSLLISYFLHVANDGVFHGTFIQQQTLLFYYYQMPLLYCCLPRCFSSPAGSLTKGCVLSTCAIQCFLARNNFV